MTEQTWIVSEFTLVLFALADLCMASQGTKVVAAIDFGTTYSAYAFAFKTDLEQMPINITMNKSWSTDTGSDMQFMKTPTAILFDENKNFHSFGYEAEDMFANLTQNNEHMTWYYFRRFKILLHSTKKKRKLKLDTLIQAENFGLNDEHDRQMPAIDVFSSSIRYLVDRTLEQITTEDNEIANDYVQWVLTVPAIWDEAAKQFMRKAANYAGIPDKSLVLALEPEAASLYCRHLKNDTSGVETSLLNANSSYVVLDAGGGIADIVTHEMTEDRSIKELYEPVGGVWGGVQVDRAYHRLLISLFGAQILRKLKKDHFHDFINMMKTFEYVKLSIPADGEDEVEIQIPFTLEAILEETYNKTLSAFINQSTYMDQIDWDDGKLIFQAKLFRSLFSKSTDYINNAIENLLEKSSVSGTDTIVLVGGFAESALLQNSIKTTFKDRTVLIPEHPSLAIVKGAVLFGHMPDIIQTRKCKVTYGVSALRGYIPGGMNMFGVFDKLAEKGESLMVGTSRYRIYSTVNQTQSTLHLKIYTSTSEYPKYVSDRTCSFLGHLLIDGISSDSNSVFVEIIFGDTELTARAMEQSTATSLNAVFNFLKL